VRPLALAVGCNLGQADVAGFTAPHLGTLPWYKGNGFLDDAAAARLAAALPLLRQLEMSSSGLGTTGGRSLAAGLPALESLNVSLGGTGRTGAVHLILLRGLARLGASGCILDAASVCSSAPSPDCGSWPWGTLAAVRSASARWLCWSCAC
jgi:hypothetical protein